MFVYYFTYEQEKRTKYGNWNSVGYFRIRYLGFCLLVLDLAKKILESIYGKFQYQCLHFYQHLPFLILHLFWILTA